MMLQDEMKLKTYIESSTDKDTKKWWAQNAESHGDFEVAIQQYQDIGDVFSLVRIYCQNGDIAKALELAGTNVGNLGAQYLVARYFESDGKWNDAIAYYSKAKCFSNAIKIAKQHKFDKELLQLALQSSPPHMCDVAKYFESLNINEKAIMLYSKAGKSKKALELCFKTENTYMLESIMSQIDPKADSLLFQQASNYLSERGSHESALKLLISAKKFDEVLII
jgi:intraflagellar transport protein 140